MVDYRKADIFKIVMLGSSNTGKTAIINRIVNNTFTPIYDPTIDITTYSMLYNLSDDDVKDKTYIELMIEDVFGLNNLILQCPEAYLKSSALIQLRKKMLNDFHDIMFTSLEKRNKLSEEGNTKKKKKDIKLQDNKKQETLETLFSGDAKKAIERIGFIIVFDASGPPDPNDPEKNPDKNGTFEDAKFLFEKLYNIEKTNNFFFEKCIFINKIDKALDKKKLKNYTNELEKLKKKFKCDYYKVSALTSEGINEGFRKFLSKIHQKKMDEKQNEGIEVDQDIEYENEPFNLRDKLESCGNSLFCGSKIFDCGGRQEEEEN